jgi:hypothetical protein
MSGSDISSGTVAGASTVAAGTTSLVVTGNAFGWLAIFVGSTIVASSLVLFVLKVQSEKK